jgi:DNA-binding NarL/FixJ family response regulator
VAGSDAGHLLNPPLVKEGGHVNTSSSHARRTALLVDQHPLWLDTVQQVVERADVDVRAKITSSQAAHDQLLALEPDLLVTGIKMGDGEMDGLALVRSARERVPGIRVIVLSMYDDSGHIDAAFAAGAAAYVVKTAHPDDLTSAVRQAFMHSIYLAGARPTPAPVPTQSDESPGLTRRELEILKHVAEGNSNAQVARMLWVTEQTVKFHLSNIYRKLDVANRTEASRWAQLHGLLNQPALQVAA